MGYGGKQASRSGDIRRFNFTGNGSNTAFGLGFTPASQNQLIVTVNGLVQHYDAFSISGSTLTFTGTPASGDAIQVTAVVDAVGVAGIPDGAIANVSSLAVSGAATFANTVAVTGAITASSNTLSVGTSLYSIANGNVGIGISSPAYQLDLNGGATVGSRIQLRRGSDDTAQSMRIGWDRIESVRSDVALSSPQTTMSFIQTGSDGSRTTMLIDSSGRVTKPYQPAFRAGLSTTWAGPSGVTIIPFASANYNIGTHYNTSTYRFTAPVAGRYLFTCSIGTGGNSQSFNYFGILVFVNNSSVLNGWNSKTTSTSYISDSKSCILNLAVNDYVEFKLESERLQDVSSGMLCGHLLS